MRWNSSSADSADGIWTVSCCLDFGLSYVVLLLPGLSYHTLNFWLAVDIAGDEIVVTLGTDGPVAPKSVLSYHTPT